MSLRACPHCGAIPREGVNREVQLPQILSSNTRVVNEAATFEVFIGVTAYVCDCGVIFEKRDGKA